MLVNFSNNKNIRLIITILATLLTLFLLMACSSSEKTEIEDIEPSEKEEVEEVEEQIEIIGVDSDAGIMKLTDEAIETYELPQYLVKGSNAIMTAELMNAINNKDYIVVTGWTPHWKFDEWELKFLEDPEGVYGGEEYVANVANQNLKTNMPPVYLFLENYTISKEQIQEVMNMNNKAPDLEDNANKWVAENPNTVEEWLPEDWGEGGDVEILTANWDCAIASSYIAQEVLQQMGYNVTITEKGVVGMWSSLADGKGDFLSCAWLPSTHGDHWEKYGDNLVEVSQHFTSARTGLVVPQYMDINSIDDLQSK